MGEGLLLGLLPAFVHSYVGALAATARKPLYAGFHVDKEDLDLEEEEEDSCAYAIAADIRGLLSMQWNLWLG